MWILLYWSKVYFDLKQKCYPLPALYNYIINKHQSSDYYTYTI